LQASLFYFFFLAALLLLLGEVVAFIGQSCDGRGHGVRAAQKGWYVPRDMGGWLGLRELGVLAI